MKREYEVVIPQPQNLGHYQKGKDIAQVIDKEWGGIFVAKKVKGTSSEFNNMKAFNHRHVIYAVDCIPSNDGRYNYIMM